MSRIPSGVRAVFFDAVGTLLHLSPDVATVYTTIGRQFGSLVDATEIQDRFRAAFAEQEAIDCRNNHRTSETREVARWRAIVRRVLDDVINQDGCFDALYAYFAEPRAWRTEPGTGETIAALTQAGYIVGLASNFDHRLRAVVEGQADLQGLSHRVISSLVGWKKPAPPFFARMCDEAQLSPSQILYIGDDLENDYRGATDFGMHALWFDPKGRSTMPPECRLSSLKVILPPEKW